MSNIKDIPQVEEYKYLGIFLDEKLNYTHHIDYLSEKIRQRAKVFKKIIKNYSVRIRLILWQSMM